MKRIRRVSLVIAISLIACMLGGCGTKETVFTSKDGIHINATTKWKEATEEQLLEEIYKGITKEDLQYVDLALTTYDDLVFLIEKTDISEYRDSIVEDVEFTQEMMLEMADMGLTDEEDIAAVFAEMGIEYTQEDQAYLDEITAEGFDMDQYVRETMAIASEESLEQYSQYSLLDSRETTALGEPAYIREYTYQNGSDAYEMHAYELDVVKGDIAYTLYAAAPAQKFEAKKEQLQTMISSAYEGEVKEESTDKK